MKYLLIAILSVNLFASNSDTLTYECEEAIAYATKIHMDYVNGHASIKDTYDATAVMKEICGD